MRTQICLRLGESRKLIHNNIFLPLDGSHFVCYPLHLPMFWMINFKISKIKDDESSRAGSLFPSHSPSFLHLSVIHCRQLDASVNPVTTVQDPTNLLPENRHNLYCALKKAFAASCSIKTSNSKFQISNFQLHLIYWPQVRKDFFQD